MTPNVDAALAAQASAAAQSVDGESTDEHPPVSKKNIGGMVVLLLLVNLATSLYQLPLNRLVEKRLCLGYYLEHDPSAVPPDGSVQEELCKVDKVQEDLAWIQGVMDTIWIVGDLVMTIPLGFMAERYGRRSILWLNLVPRLFMLSWAMVVGYFDRALPTTAIMAGPVLSVLGGDCVFNSITYALAANMTDDHVLRATYFGFMSSVSYIVALIGPALASATMSILLWLPFWIGIAMLILAIPMISLLPRQSAMYEYALLNEEDPATPSTPLLSFPRPKDIDPSPSLLRSVGNSFRSFQATIASHPRNFSLLLVTFVLTSLASSDTKLLVQYISKRYYWTFASAGYLISGKAVVNFILLAVVVPKILRSRNSRNTPADRSDIKYADVCLVISAAGALGIAFAGAIWILIPGLLVYAFGSALPIFTLSLLKSPSICPAEEERRPNGPLDAETHIFSIVMMVRTLGSLLGAPLMAALWVSGIAIGGVGLGLPYFISALCYLLAIGVFACIKLE